MTPEERDLRRALGARSGEPSAAFRARLTTALGAGRPATRPTPALAMVAAVFLAVAVIAVLLLARHGAGLPPTPGRASSPRALASATPATGMAVSSIVMYGEAGWTTAHDPAGPPMSVFHTADGGTAWLSVTPAIGADRFISGFVPVDANRAWVIAASATAAGTPADLLETRDGGQTWLKTSASGVFDQAVITFIDDTHGWLAAPGGRSSQDQWQGVAIDRTVDGGRTWQLVAQTSFPSGPSTAGAPSVNCGKSGLSFLNASTGWLTGGCTAGVTFDMTTDGGRTWTAQRLTAPGGGTFLSECQGGPCALSAPRFVSPGYGYMVLHDTGPTADRSWLYVTRDGGRSWTMRSLPGQETRVTMLTAAVGFASVGPIESAPHWLYRTDDGGASWQPVVNSAQLAYGALTCVSESKCWALSPSLSGPDPSTRLYLTTDGGRTWHSMAMA